MHVDLLIRHGQLATMEPSGGGEAGAASEATPAPSRGRAMRDIGWVEDGAVAVKDGRIAWVGQSDAANREGIEASVEMDAGGRLVTPGLVDPHTHLVHAGSREYELALKLAGVPYLEILRRGGGILSTVKATRAASEEALTQQALVSLRRMLEGGVTTVEAKSGYGLNAEVELRQLRVAKALAELQPVEVVSTFLGPHAVPPEAKADPDAFLSEMMALLHPIHTDGLAEFADIFCEDGVFSIEQSRRFLMAAKQAGFGVKIHADEMEPLGGAELAAELGAVSADHLLAASRTGLQAMAEAGCIAVLLPGTSWNLGAKTHADARYLIDEAGAAVALATDYNPGSCPTESLQLIMALAANVLRMTPEEILTAVTRNAAFAVGRGERIGSIAVGKQADLCVWNARNPAYLVYHFGVNHVDTVVKRGTVVVQDGRRVG
ncbi:MAG: imidazolonepropionase [Alicyclobacillus sp.]|nr:imidazolonepropionase [Alicyclobacillus sp.]